MKTLRPRFAPATNQGGWKPDSHRGSRHERGYGAEWERTRLRILERDHGICQPCLKEGKVHEGLEVDHKVSKAEARSLGWTNVEIEDDSNLQAINRECHRLKTSSEARGSKAP